MSDTQAQTETQGGQKQGRGRIVSVQGPVVDLYFEELSDVPAMFHAVETHTIDGKKVVLQTAEHLSSHVVRTVALMDTLNLQLNGECWNTFQPITIPMGDGCYGRVMDATGRALDNGGEFDCPVRVPTKYIFRPAGFNLKNKKGERAELLETGIKYFDLAHTDGLIGYGDKGALVYGSVPRLSPLYGLVLDGDVIKKVDDVEINSNQSLSELINGYKIGAQTEFLIQRDGQEFWDP